MMPTSSVSLLCFILYFVHQHNILRPLLYKLIGS